MIRCVLTALITFFVGALSANAVLLQTDLRSAQDGLLTLDTSSALEWLDLSETRGYSFLDIQSQLATPSGPLEAFRFATIQEVDALFLAAGMTSTNQIDRAEDFAAAGAFLNLVGVTQDRFGSRQAIGFTSTIHTPGYARTAFVTQKVNQGTAHAVAAGSTFVRNVAEAGPEAGAWLVRVAQVPEPSITALALSSATLLALWLISHE